MSNTVVIENNLKNKDLRKEMTNELSYIKNAIEIKNITKNYSGFAVKDISFNVPMGSIMGFVGENGAGKTTTIKAILDLIQLDGGSINLLGSDSKKASRKIKEQIGVVFDGSNLHENMTVNNINSIMKNIYSNWDEVEYKEYSKKFELPENKRIKEFSRGMKMKLSIAIALSHQSKLLILDEATSGLDPIVRDEILDIFLEFIQDEERTILLSSHIISDIEKIADYVTFIHKGRIVFSESKDDLIYQHGVVHCRKEDVASIDRSYILGVRENSFGTDVMVKNKDAFLRRYHQYKVEKTSIEEIMLFIHRGKEK